MKKKGLLGILAVLMVFALALTGCGQQGEQNAGATGSESQNEAIDSGNKLSATRTTLLVRLRLSWKKHRALARRAIKTPLRM